MRGNKICMHSALSMFNTCNDVTILCVVDCCSQGLVLGLSRPICIRDTFLARDVIYTSRAYATMSVSVCL